MYTTSNIAKTSLWWLVGVNMYSFIFEVTNFLNCFSKETEKNKIG